MTVVGIDIGSAALRAVEVNNPGGLKPTLVRYHEVALPAGAVSSGEVVEPNTVAAALRALWSEGGFSTKRVVLGMGNQRVLARNLSVPRASLKQIRASLPLEVQDLLPMPVAEALLDFYPISETTTEHGAMVNGLLIAAVKATVLANVRTAALAGLTTVDVDLIPFALSRVLVTRPGLTGTVALIDIGANTTSVVIAKDGVPQFVRIIPTGGDDVSAALIGGLETDAETAESIKRSRGLVVPAVTPPLKKTPAPQAKAARTTATAAAVPEPVDPALGIIAEVTTEQLASLRNTINYYVNTHAHDPVGRIILSGGGAQLSGLSTALSEVTRLPVIEADPFAAVSLARSIDEVTLRHKSASLAVALGLALGSAA